MIGDNDVLRKDPTTGSVCEGEDTGLKGGEGRKVGGGDIILGGGLISNGFRYRPQMGCLEGATDLRLYVDSAGMVEGPNIRRDQRCHAIRRSSRDMKDQQWAPN